VSFIESEGVRVYHGDCRDIMEGQLADNSVDSIVTDPPYELGFMGKKWDDTGIAYNCEVWENAYRVLKPGGHLLAFGGTRTWHRLAVAIEDAGFEIRDSIAWHYGSGFPKSLDVSKAIDKSDAKQERRARDLKFTQWMRASGLSQKDCAAIIRPLAKNDATAFAMAQHYYSDKQQPAVPVQNIFDLLRPHLPFVPDDIERLVFDRTVESKNFAEREVVGKGFRVDKKTSAVPISGATPHGHYDITAPATPEAQKWSGFGTALKPAHEPIVVARKPLIGTVAENVLTHGTGALNIDGCRIAHTGTENMLATHAPSKSTFSAGASDWTTPMYKPAGRWPANVILDESQAAELDKQSGNVKAATSNSSGGKEVGIYGSYGSLPKTEGYNDSGGASRFFYVAKAGKKERPNVDGIAHPTVKPIALMRYLVRLVTPPGGTVLEPFAGSGTTVEACILEGFNCIAIEMTDDYLPLIAERVRRSTEDKEGRLL
jgi:site-specific DNA-methyltransferase (adenine-specific)